MRRTDPAGGMGGVVRRAVRWHAPRPSDDGLRALAEVLLCAGHDEAFARVVHVLGAWCRFASPATATDNVVRDHNERALRDDRPLPRLRGKAAGFRRCCSRREIWAWLACR